MSEKRKLCQVAKYQAEDAQIRYVVGKPFYTIAHIIYCESSSGIYFIISILLVILWIKYFVYWLASNGESIM